MSKRYESSDLAVQVGARIQSLRLERGLSLRTVAEIAKCSPSTISLIERGRSSIHLRMLRKIARALHVKPFDLLNHTPENDDVGYIIEQMRRDWTTVATVKSLLKTLKVSARPRLHAN
jgi:transcriptional regulator with XRE-family HTH domain